MKIPAIPFLLMGGRFLAIAYVLLALVMTISFIKHTFEVALDNSTVKLELDTSRPPQFSLLGSPADDVKSRGTQDYAEGQKAASDSYASSEKATQITQRGIAPNGFRLSSASHIRQLEYVEPNPWKRVGLYYAGASDQRHSLLKVLYYTLVSWLLLRMSLDTTSTAPFIVANARRLEYLSLVIFGLYLAQELSYRLIRELIPPFQVPAMAQPLSHYVLLNTENELPGAVVVFILSIIALVYRRGVELHQEAELTV